MSKSNILTCLWEDAYLEKFAHGLAQQASNEVFWEFDECGELVDFRRKHIKNMMMRFFPAMGVRNLVLGGKKDGIPNQILIFLREKRCEQIDVETLRLITGKVFSFLGDLGAEIQSQFVGVANPFTKEYVNTIPSLYDKRPFSDSQDRVYRYFSNGWVAITAEGVSELRSYQDIPDDMIVWNSSVIKRDYVDVASLDQLNQRLQLVNAEGKHPLTGESLDKETRKAMSKELRRHIDEHGSLVLDTHFKDFVENLARNEEGDLDPKNLDRLERVIGYLCHRYHRKSDRRYVVIVDTFTCDGPSYGSSSNGGSGKSLLVALLGKLMNLTELDGRSFKKTTFDIHKKFAPVTPATELVHLDDVSKGFPAECLFTLATGDFHIDRKYQNPFSIPAESAPKIVVTSNFPLEGEGNSYRRRECVISVSTYYRDQQEMYGETPYHIHGCKHLGDDHDWSESDWSQFYSYSFHCVSKYLALGLPESNSEGKSYQRQRIIDAIGSVEVLDYLISCLDEYSEHGGEVFAEVFYKRVRAQVGEHLEDISNSTLWDWFVKAGQLAGKHPNKHKRGKLDPQRLSKERWNRWVAEGMEHHKNKNGECYKEGTSRVETFKVCSFKRPETMFDGDEPNFSRKSDSPNSPPHRSDRHPNPTDGEFSITLLGD